MAGALPAAHHRLVEAVEELRAAGGPAATDDELISVLTLCEGLTRRLDQLTVATIADLERRGTFTERGYKSAAPALGDLLGWERFEARRRVSAAAGVCPRVGLDGSALPPQLPATAEVFDAGHAGLRHVEVVAKVLATPAAMRLAPEVWAGAEAQLAAHAAEYTPTELHSWGTALVDALDQDGAEPDDTPPPPVNELHLLPNRGRSGGRLKARFDDPALYDAIAALIDTHAKPLDADDHRTTPHARPRPSPTSVDTSSTTARCPRPAGTAPTSTCSCGSTIWRTAAAPHVSTSVARSPRSRCACWPATPASRRSFSTARGSRSTSASRNAPSPTGCAARSPPATTAAPTPAATARRPGARSTTSASGRMAARLPCTTS